MTDHTPASLPEDTVETRAVARREKRETAAREGREAMADYLTLARAVEAKTARLRALRLSRDAAEPRVEAAKKPPKKRVRRAGSRA